MSSGVEEIVPMAGPWPERRRIGWTNQFQAIIDGLLITDAVSQKQNQMVHSVEPETASAPGLFVLNRRAGWNELLLMADQGKVVSPCGTGTIAE